MYRAAGLGLRCEIEATTYGPSMGSAISTGTKTKSCWCLPLRIDERLSHSM
jgi:hypothetical protein